ncbi:alpha-amylase family glycosyl hydrolase [Mucilaginibacter jinjuensis]|uniref:Alpha-amylase family glycosyl hydrolase n=1 Tax=Mucilaginibacter jinjuensis TaxID=1176721 RepID=A0ABY7T7G5_9SPHI|nr:alpha-amylase family glycosyl hydrolase [Mucilaginibacter jinjuensis]WCT12213.1 alpha-amylase family glycosyl hydrolase [Mucilaginibacter jinjuensis]
MRNIYVLLMALLVIGGTGCKKKSSSDDLSGNVTGNGTGKDVPTGTNDGVTFINSGKSAIFNLYAPNKTSVSVIGDFNNWQPTAMTKSTDGTRWWVQVDNIDPTKEYAYQYYIDNTIKVADPYTEKVLDPDNDSSIPSTVYPNLLAYPAGKTTGIVSVMQGSPTAYSWKNATITRPDPKNLVIYELHVRDFIGTHSYKTLTDTLNYIANLGVNAVELMPVNEFEGNDSWGYNTNFGMALDKYYGTKNDYKAFIDACHAKGIAVIQDIVLEDQFGSSPMVQMYATASGSPSASNPWFDTQNMHPDAVGYQMNHQAAATQYYFKNVVKYWMQEYHIDGFRFDQAKGFTQKQSTTEDAWAAYDATRVALWKSYNTYIKSLDPNFYVILEYFSNNQEESELAAQGMMSWTNLSTPAQQATMGYPSGPSWDLSGLFYDQYGFTNPYGLVAYFESHDEERTMFKNEAYGNASGSYSTKDIPTALKREEALAALLISSPGPKMLWEFEERGYDISIDNGGRLGDKPPHWEYMNDANRHHLYATYSHLIKWKTKNAVFSTTSYKYSLTGAIKWAALTGTDNNVVIASNFDVVNQTATVTFPSTGNWYDNITGAAINVPSTAYSLTLAPGEYHVYSSTALKM